MIPIPVPDEAKAARTDCRLVNMGPPQGVSDDDCGTAQMLIERQSTIPGYNAGRGQYAYYRPDDTDLARLNNGGFIELAQYGQVVQPFSAVVWAVSADNQDGGT